jgi:two-component system cell cycle sensor histidine kinase/response regulator CckA
MSNTKIRVLLIEDEAADIEFVKSALLSKATLLFELTSFVQFSQAIEFLKSHQCDVILLDLGLPEYGDLEALEELRSINRDIPIVVLTGLQDERTALRALEAGAQDYLVKGPLTADSLTRSIHFAIQRQQLHWERTQREQALEDRAKLSEIVVFSDDAIIGENCDGKITSWNQAAEKMFGYARQDILYQHVGLLIPDAWRAYYQNLNPTILQGTPIRDLNMDFAHRDGSAIAISLSISPIRDRAGNVIGRSNICRDIRERKQLQAELELRDEQLRQSHKLEAVGALAGGIAHEFNNLLQAICGYTRYAMEEMAQGEQCYLDLEQVLKAADRASTLTRGLLGFSRRQILERRNVDPQEIVADLVKMLRPLIGEHIDLRISGGSEKKILYADRGLLQQMLLNLCINARDAMPQGGQLSLELQYIELAVSDVEINPHAIPGEYVLMTVADTGHGMSPEVQARIYEPFFTTKEIGKGTGLGLAMVYGCVQQHQGFIKVHSEVGQGTTFEIYLPLFVGSEQPVESDFNEPSAAAEELILLAEDEPLVRDLAVRILKRAGYSVLVAVDGEDAVKQFDANSAQIALAVLDAVMPKRSGHQVYDHIRKSKPELPVVFCSGYDPETGNVKSLDNRGMRVVQKPFVPEVFLRTLRECLDAAQAAKGELCLA